jgi:hypothetical protein
MPARDVYHDHVKQALVKDGWEVTDDPLRLEWDDTPLYIDLGAEQLLVFNPQTEEIVAWID